MSSDEPSPEPTQRPKQPPVGMEGLDPGELFARALHSVQPSAGETTWVPPEPEELARLLPQFCIETLLGHGGMGAVYKGSQPALDRPVAIKLLPAELATDEQFVARFRREARTLAQLHHQGIVTVYNSGQTSEGHLYFVMEFVEGTDIRHILNGPGLNPAQAIELISQVCDALHYAHAQGVIHRDIKPANILVTTDGQAKLADFGLARPIKVESVTITGPNAMMGTADYMAPEQRSGTPDRRADIYALGVMFYEMLVGKRPRGVFDPPSQSVEVDIRLDEVVFKALQQEPERRYQHVSEMKTAVDHIRTTPQSSVLEPSEKQQSSAPTIDTSAGASRRKRLAVPVAILLVIAAIVGISIWSTPRRPPDETRTIASGDSSAGRDSTGSAAAKARTARIARESEIRAGARAALAGTGGVLPDDCVKDWFQWGVTLDMRGTPLHDPSVLRSLPLDGLDISSTHVTDISSLGGVTVRYFSCAHNNIQDVSPLLEMPRLEAAFIPQSASNIEVLRDHPTLKYLGWEGDWDGDGHRPRLILAEFWKRYDAQPDAVNLRARLSKAGWKGFQLRVRSNGTYELRAQGRGITDLSPLAGAPISLLYVTGNPITSLEPLRGMPLRKLWANASGVSDLEPLRGMALEALCIHNTKVTDLSPLVGTPLRDLFADGNPQLKDLRPLAQIGTLEDILLPSADVDPTPLRNLPNLKFLGDQYGKGGEGTGSGKRAAEFWAEYDAKHPASGR